MIATLAQIAPENAAQGEQLSAARAQADRLHRFVANLLDMARIEAGALAHSSEPVDLAEAIAAAVHDLKPQLQGHPIRMDVAPDLPFVLVDPRLFHHCLINLIDNAVKYGKAKGQITFAARRQRDGLDLMITDEGPGLPPGREAHIFETFARIEGSDRKGGTGLGLAIVKGFAGAMGVAVLAANRADGHGACFTLRFGEALLRRPEAEPEPAA